MLTPRGSPPSHLGARTALCVLHCLLANMRGRSCTCCTSMPRASKSVVMSTREEPERNSRIMTSRVFWSMSPCVADTVWSLSRILSVSQSTCAPHQPPHQPCRFRLQIDHNAGPHGGATNWAVTQPMNRRIADRPHCSTFYDLEFLQPCTKPPRWTGLQAQIFHDSCLEPVTEPPHLKQTRCSPSSWCWRR